MTIDDLDWIRGKNERRREELESRLAEQRKLRAAMSAELRRVQEALDKEYGAQSPPDTPGVNRGNLTLVHDEPVPGYSETCFHPSANDVIDLLGTMASIKAELAEVETCLEKLRTGRQP